MNLQNKTVFFLGDSITEGVGVSAPEKNYVSVFAELSHAVVGNYGISGTRIAKQRKPSENPAWDQDFLSRVEQMEDGADVIVVFGGTNDFGHGDAEFGDFNSRSEHTFYGALHILCQKLINKYPQAEIVFMTPLHRRNELETVNEFGRNRMLLVRYVDAIIEVAGYYGLPVLDLFRTSGLQPNLPVIRDTYAPDELHPNDAGARRIAQRLCAFLSTL